MHTNYYVTVFEYDSFLQLLLHLLQYLRYSTAINQLLAFVFFFRDAVLAMSLLDIITAYEICSEMD